tara:strand:+ start:565 stop:1005 length:441 start_codon:yes stop_codon:yes gene_type:complete
MAKKFNFNLQKYLDYKATILNNKAAQLLKSKKIVQEENKKLNVLVDKKEKISNDFKSLKPKKILELSIMNDYSNQISKNIDIQKERLDVKKEELENEKISLNKNYKEKKVIDNLKQKQLIKHKDIMKKIDEKNMDDLYISRAARQS